MRPIEVRMRETLKLEAISCRIGQLLGTLSISRMEDEGIVDRMVPSTRCLAAWREERVRRALGLRAGDISGAVCLGL